MHIIDIKQRKIPLKRIVSFDVMVTLILFVFKSPKNRQHTKCNRNLNYQQLIVENV